MQCWCMRCMRVALYAVLWCIMADYGCDAKYVNVYQKKKREKRRDETEKKEEKKNVK